jgi:uncharacterized phiE125 gp8 family phage protein
MAFIKPITHTSPEVISLAMARKQLQLEADFTEDDDLIASYIESAISEAENFINQEITEKKFEIQGKSFQDALVFNKQILQSVESIEYKNEAGTLIPIDASNYYLQTVDKYETTVEFAENYVFPTVKEYTPDAVIVKFTVGYASGTVPKAIIQALLLMITHAYENRTDSIKEKSTAAENKLHKYKRF